MTVGLTNSVPNSALIPVQPPEAVQVVTFADDQVRIDDWPAVMADGEAERERLDADGGGVGGAAILVPKLTLDAVMVRVTVSMTPAALNKTPT